MTVIFIPGNAPSYQIESTDITAGSLVSGVSYIGAKVYATDTGKWYRVLNDLTLEEFSYPVGGNGYIATGSFQGVSASKVYNIYSTILPVSACVVEVPNAVRVNGGTAYITDIDLITSASGLTPVIRLHFYSASTITSASNSGSWVDLYADVPYMLGYYTMPALVSASGSSTNCSRSTTTDADNVTQPRILVMAQPDSKSIFFGTENRTAFTANGSQLWTVKLHLDQN